MFFPNFFCCPRISTRMPHDIWSCLLWTITFCQLFHVFDDFVRFEEYWSGILQNVPQFGFVSWLDCSYGFLGRRPQMWSSLITLHQGYMLLMCIITDINIDHLVKVVFARFLHRMLSPLYTYPLRLYSLEASNWAKPTMRGSELNYTSLNLAGKNLHKWFGILLYRKFISSCISIWIQIFICWVIIQYYVIHCAARIVPTLATGSFFRLAPVSLWRNPSFFFFEHLFPFWHYKTL